jgi:hypothetical protein
VSRLPEWASDALCRLSTGAGFGVRELYTDASERLFAATRPVILNGITNIIERSDLAERAITLSLKRIEDRKRRTEAEIWAAFNAEQPSILGALLDALVVGLRGEAEIALLDPPRMADFAKWATACEPALWSSGTFARAYKANQLNTVDAVVEDDIVADADCRFADKKAPWSGAPTALLDELTILVGDTQAKSRRWPRAPNALSRHLRRSATFLRRLGVAVEFAGGGRAGRSITVSKTAAK